ncbi:uncharacterized protein LOC124179316 isoform X1 [Neodiprion fabricii]|uniref:uncharacterized protein LOC124179316 isoform X1 n=1 Tax=Neodiprion fabricii TaxID=2872261 RepID=UPI001ED8C3FA|nr:uncharacterized protein LOC124179316 isoform X1 [Neodiprion fabricii]XP_046419481.1 uncharacterized protein LOC124179316 isoform X1 [Neodiprion fabricii]
MSQPEQNNSMPYEREMSTSKSSSLLRLNQEAREWPDHETDSEISENEFITKGAFLLTPSHELSMDKAVTICEKMNFRGAFSLTKTATGILFKFSSIDDFQAVFKKGFHKVTGARFYKKLPNERTKVAIPCRPAKIFTVYVLDVPEEVPEDDIRHALYKYRSIVEVTRLPLNTGNVLKAINDKIKSETQNSNEAPTIYTGPPVIRVTLANVDETSMLLSRGLDFYGATYFPTETPHPASQPFAKFRNNRWADVASPGTGQRVRDLLPVFDNAGFNKLPPPTSRTIKPPRN